MATGGPTATPSPTWMAQGVNTPPNSVATAFTMPTPGGLITTLHALLRQEQGEFYRRGLRTMKLNVDTLCLTQAYRLYERAGMQTGER